MNSSESIEEVLAETLSLLSAEQRQRFYQLIESNHDRNQHFERLDVLKVALFTVIFVSNELFYLPVLDDYVEHNQESQFYAWAARFGISLSVIGLSFNAARELVEEYKNNHRPGTSVNDFPFILVTAIYSAVTTGATALANPEFEPPLPIIIAIMTFIAYSTIHTLSTRKIDEIPILKALMQILLFPPWLVVKAYQLFHGTFHLQREHLEARAHMQHILQGAERLLARTQAPLPHLPFMNPVVPSLWLDDTLREILKAKGTQNFRDLIHYFHQQHGAAFHAEIRNAMLQANPNCVAKALRYAVIAMGSVFGVASCYGFFESPIKLISQQFGDLPFYIYGPLLYYGALVPDFIVGVLVAKYGAKAYLQLFDSGLHLLQGNFAVPPIARQYPRSILPLLILITAAAWYSCGPTQLFVQTSTATGLLRDFTLFCAGMAGNGCFYLASSYVALCGILEILSKFFGTENNRLVIENLERLRLDISGIDRLTEHDIVDVIDGLLPDERQQDAIDVEKTGNERIANYHNTASARFFDTLSSQETRPKLAVRCTIL